MDQPDAKRVRMQREERTLALLATDDTHTPSGKVSSILTVLAKMERGLQQQQEMITVLMAKQETILDRLGAGVAEGTGLARTVEKIGRDIEAVAKNQYELRKENEELRQLNKEGYFNFAVRVNGDDFLAFAVIMALGNRKAAADHLKIPARTFYHRVDQWAGRGRDYQLMLRYMEWRKRSSRHLKVELNPSLQSGESDDQPENPETIADVLTEIKAADTKSYPALFAEVLQALERQNSGNWMAVRKELVELIKEEALQ